MILVMLVHYLPLRSPTNFELFNINPFKSFYNLELKSICFICVHCFILISGYFGIKWKRKSFGGLIFQIIFWLFIGYFIVKCFIEPFIPTGNNYSLSTFVKQMIVWHQGRWFISAYITLYILSPLINSFIEHSTEQQIIRFLIVFYIFSTIYGWLFLSQEFNTGLSAVSLLGLYMIGAWLRKSNLKIVHWNKWYDLSCFIGCTFILTFISAFLIYIGVHKSIYGYLNPIVILESIFLFQFFRKVNFGHISWINFLGGSAFAAFLLHCHPMISPFYNKVFIALHQYNYALLYVFIYIFIVFLFAILLDKVRILIWGILSKMQLFDNKIAISINSILKKSITNNK